MSHRPWRASSSHPPQRRNHKTSGKTIPAMLAHQLPEAIHQTSHSSSSRDQREGSMGVAAAVTTKDSIWTRIRPSTCFLLLLASLLLEVKQAQPRRHKAHHVHRQQRPLGTVLTHCHKRTRTDSYRTS